MRHNAASLKCVSHRCRHVLVEGLRVYPFPVSRGLPVTGRGRLARLVDPLPTTDLPVSSVLIEVSESRARLRRCAMQFARARALSADRAQSGVVLLREGTLIHLTRFQSARRLRKSNRSASGAYLCV